MRARVPMDVDLEDRLLFGLPPMRLGYVVIAAVTALAAWRMPWVGAPVAIVVVAIGVAFGWGQWRGRGPDHWVVAAVLWAIRTRRLDVTPRAQLRLPRHPRKRPLLPPRPPATIHVLHVLRDPEPEP